MHLLQRITFPFYFSPTLSLFFPFHIIAVYYTGMCVRDIYNAFCHIRMCLNHYFWQTEVVDLEIGFELWSD